MNLVLTKTLGTWKRKTKNCSDYFLVSIKNNQYWHYRSCTGQFTQNGLNIITIIALIKLNRCKFLIQFFEWLKLQTIFEFQYFERTNKGEESVSSGWVVLLSRYIRIRFNTYFFAHCTVWTVGFGENNHFIACNRFFNKFSCHCCWSSTYWW